MSTPCIIAVQDGDVVRQISCERGGDPLDVGKTLLREYNSETSAHKLIAGGDLFLVDWGGALYYAERSHWDSGHDNHPWERCMPRVLLAPSVGRGYGYLWREGQWWGKTSETDWEPLVDLNRVLNIVMQEVVAACLGSEK